MYTDRQQIADVLFTAATVAVGILSGNPIIASVVTGIGVNLASDLTRVGWRRACRWLMGESGLLNHDLQQALDHAFHQAISHLEQIWWQTPRGHQMRQKEPDTANATAAIFRLLKEDAGAFCTSDHLRRIADDEQVRRLLSGETDARCIMSERLADYLYGHDPQLVAFLEAHLIGELTFWFGEELKVDRPENNRAWRAFQHLLLEGIDARLAEVQVGLAEVQVTEHELRQALAEMRAWAGRMDVRPPEERESTGQPGLEQAIVDARDQLLDAIVREAGLTRTAIETRLEQIVQLLRQDLPRDVARALVELFWQRDEQERRRREQARLRVVNTSVRPDVSVTFQNRVAEVDWLCAHLAEPSTRLVVITGRGGYGKTALVARTLAEAETGSLGVDGRVLPIRGVAYFNPQSTGLTLGRLYADLGDLLGEPFASVLADRWQDKTIPLHDKAHFLLDQMVRACQGDEVILIVFDGLEAALNDAGRLTDEGLCRWLEAYLGSGGPLRVIVTSRQEWYLPDEVADYPYSLLNLEHGVPNEDAVALLQALDPDGRCGLRDAEQTLLKRAAQQTGGIPFSLKKIAGLLRTSRRLTLARLLDDAGLFTREVTLALADLGYNHLASDERRVMEVLSVYGRPVPAVAVAFALIGEQDLAGVEAVLDELTRSYFVTYHRDTDSWALQDTDSQVVNARLSQEDRIAFHTRAGDYYETSGDKRDLLKAVQHFDRAGEYIHAARLATADIWTLIHQGQAQELSQVLKSVVVHPLPPALRVDVNVALGDVCEFLGDHDTALAQLQEAMTALESHAMSAKDRGRAADIARRIGRLHGWRGDMEEAFRWMATGRSLLGAGQSEAARDTLALIDIHTASLHYQQGQCEQAEALCRQALRLLGDSGSPAVRAEGYLMLGSAQDKCGKPEDALQAYQHSTHLWATLGNDFQIARTENNMAVIYSSLGDLPRARGMYERVLEYFLERVGDRNRSAVTLTNLGNIAYILGDYEVAIAHHLRAIGYAHDLDIPWLEALARVNLAWVHVGRGEWNQAEGQARQSISLQTAHAISESLPEANRVLAHATAERDQLDTARTWAEQALSLARQQDNKLEEGAAERVLGKVLRQLRDFQAAGTHLQRSLEILEEIGDRFEAARTRRQLAWLNRDLGDEATALIYAIQSLTVFVTMNAEGEAADMQAEDRLHFWLQKPLIDAMTFCRSQITAVGWQEVAQSGAGSDSVVLLRFGLEDHRLAVELAADGNTTVVSLCPE
jgi:tetratricopeptide (TPR) repeat protein